MNKQEVYQYLEQNNIENEGISTDSTHGNAVWYQMRLIFITGNDKF